MASPIKLSDMLAAKHGLRETRRLLYVASSGLLEDIDALLSVAEVEIDRVIDTVRREVR